MVLILSVISNSSLADYSTDLKFAPENNLCAGKYTSISYKKIAEHQIQIQADKISYRLDKPTLLTGNVEVLDNDNILKANNAQIFKTNGKVSKIILSKNVVFQSKDLYLVAKSALVLPLKNYAGTINSAVYRFNFTRKNASLPPWGTASKIIKTANNNIILYDASYTNCSPLDPFWTLDAKKISLNKDKGVARNATLKIKNIPILYTPYISFPTNNDRKSGFLIPIPGYSNIGGYDIALPYYLNLAPNYDMTLIPHFYSKRGLLMGAQHRLLTKNTSSVVEGYYNPHDHFDTLDDERWSVAVHSFANLPNNLQASLNYEKVSDPTFFQDYSRDFTITSARQLLQQADLIYNGEDFELGAMLQGYQTLNPVGEESIASPYQRLPHLFLQGYKDFENITTSYRTYFDNFHYPDNILNNPEGSRWYSQTNFSKTYPFAAGYLKPSVEFINNNYQTNQQTTKNLLFSRWDLDAKIIFEKKTSSSTQTIEPHLNYLYVPYKRQDFLPNYDTSYFFFNTAQLFRNNRFSGFDRIGDTNQLTTAITARMFDKKTVERANLTVGQINFFAPRRVNIYNNLNDDNAHTSPITSELNYFVAPALMTTVGYSFDTSLNHTYNAYLNLHYQPKINEIFNIGYSYIFAPQFVAHEINQLTTSYAWPYNDNWSSLGIFSYNISDNYPVAIFGGFQYDSCCWALRLMAGKSFQSLVNTPQYNNNFYLQFLLKGLGSLGHSPSSFVGNYLNNYVDTFR